MLRWIGVVAALNLVFGSVVMAEPARAVAGLTNQYRAQYGLPPLRVSGLLEVVADRHGADMARNRFFDHQGSDGTDVAGRALGAGYRYCVIAENIAKGHVSARDVTRGWIRSPGHRENLLDASVTDIGIVRKRGNIWVMVLGRAGC
ncbi:MAG: CAP domain-containing protein [Cognatishimia sp.]